MKILIVEDKQEARYLLEVLLKGNGHEVISTANGVEALKVVEGNRLDLIVSDILMPEMDGFKFCQTLKRDNNHKNIPFIFYTATYVEQKDEEFAMGLGADLFLRKPMEPEFLLQEIEKVLNNVKSGSFNPRKLTLKRDQDLYKMYNERLIKKLEEKIFQMEEEIEKRSQAEMKLKVAICEKEILLRELYHRTRNNMQVISSMLKLYSTRILDIKWLKIVKDINSKIKTTALVHQKLYESKDLSHLNLKEYFLDLIKYVEDNYPRTSKKVNIITDLDDINVLLDTAIPLGFVLNELVTNSFEHAFSEQEEGNITIQLRKKENGFITLIVEDDGIGLPDDFDLLSERNMGLVIISNIINKQLMGAIKFSSHTGAHWEIEITNQSYSERV